MAIKVEVDLANSGVWTDISTYVDSASIRRGRSHETDAISPGTLSMDLYNDGGRFTPGLTSGPYYPNIKVNRPVRVSYGIFPVYLFTGRIDSIVPAWSGGMEPMVTIAATDGFKGLQRRVSQSFYTESVMNAPGLTSVAYYPLSEPTGAQTFGSLTPTNLPPVAVQKDSKYGGGTITPGITGGWLSSAPAATYCTFTFSGTGATEHLSVIQLSGGSAQNGPTLPAAGNWTMACWFKRTGTPTDRAVMLYAGAQSTYGDPSAGIGALGVSLFLDSAGAANFSVTNLQGVTATTATTFANYADGNWHYAAVTLAADQKTMNLFIDGAGPATFGGAPTVVMATAFQPPANLGWVVAGGQLSIHGDSHYGWGGSLANLEFYTGNDTASNNFSRYYNATQFSSFSPASQIITIAANAGYSVTAAPFMIADASVTTAVAPFDATGSTYLTLLQDLERTEQGLLFCRGDGALIFKNRTYRVNQTSSFALNAAGQDVSPDFQVGVDDSLLFNDYAATRPNGAVIRVRDTATTSIADNGVYTNAGTDSGADSILVTTDAEVRDYANFKVANYSQPQPRTPQITVDVKRAPDLLLTITNAAADIGSRFTVNNLPVEAPQSSMDYIIESMGWDFSGRTDTATLVMDTSPATGKVTYLTLDDAVFGLLDQATNLLFY